jgi:hypothetical protein
MIGGPSPEGSTSDQSSGAAIGAPGFARVDQVAIAVDFRVFRT